MFGSTLTPQAPRRRAGRTTLIVVVVAVVATAAVAYVLTRPHQDDVQGPRSAPSPSAQASARPDRVSLAGTSWRDFHGIRLPYSPENGPAHAGDRAWGFARTAGGAVFAAVHIGVRANAQWGPRIYAPTIHDQVTGPDASALLDQTDTAYEAAADKAGVDSGAPVGRAYAVEEAFRVEDFSPDAATVDVITAGPGSDGTTVRTATRLQLTWRHGDWRVLAPPGGDWGASARVVSSLDGFRSFGDEQGSA